MLSNQDLVLDNFKKKISSLPLWIPGAHVYDNPHFIAVDCGLPSDTFNVFLPLSSLTKDTQVSVQQAIRSFLDKGFPISIWMDQRFVTPDVVELFAELGKNEAERNITMKLESGSIGSSAPMAAGLEIKRVKSADELLQYAGVFQSLFAGSREQESLVHYFDQAAANFHIDQQHQWFVGFLDNQAVCGILPALTAAVEAKEEIAKILKNWRSWNSPSPEPICPGSNILDISLEMASRDHGNTIGDCRTAHSVRARGGDSVIPCDTRMHE